MLSATLVQPYQPVYTPSRKVWTYQDYLALPDDGRRYEIIEGELYVSNAPSLNHQFAVFEAARQIGNYVIEHKLGRVLTAPFEVHLSETTRPVQPDVMFIKTEHWPKGNAKFFEGAPDLIIEVLSSNRRLDRVVKFTAYEKAGVSKYWLVNPETHSVEVFTLSEGEYTLLKEYIADEVIESVVLAGLQVVTSSLFQE